MAEYATMTRTMTTTASTQTQLSASPVNKFQTIAKKKFEKIKNKFAEFFLSSSSTTTTTTTTENTVQYNINNNSTKSIINQSTKSIYYSNNDLDGQSLTVKQNQNQQQQHQLVLSSIVHDFSYIPHNAFLFSNQKNLRKFHNQLQMNNVDDDDFQSNLFDRTFMIDYIAFRLIQQLSNSDLINKFHLDLRIPYFRNEFNLIYNIAKQIYNESESEPMGLNGLNIVIELELNEQQQQQEQQQQVISKNDAITRFRFNQNSTLTTFELKLVLKEDSNIICLRKFLPKTKLFDKLRIQSAIYLDSKYILLKRKLY